MLPGSSREKTAKVTPFLTRSLDLTEMLIKLKGQFYGPIVEPSLPHRPSRLPCWLTEAITGDISPMQVLQRSHRLGLRAERFWKSRSESLSIVDDVLDLNGLELCCNEVICFDMVSQERKMQREHYKRWL